ncbi:hypothetical protein FI667_g13965, partial [Globisporangium splendens]
MTRSLRPHLTTLVGDYSAPRVLAGIVEFLEYADAVCLLVCAIEARSETLVRFLYAHEHLLLLGDDEKKYASVLHCAAAHGRIAVVQWVLRHRSMRESRNKSHVGCVRPFEPTNATITSLAMAWVNRNVPYLFPSDVMYEAAKQGDLEVVEWLHTTTQYEPYKAMEFAADRGHLEVAQWIYNHRTSAILPTASTAAAEVAKDAAQIYMLEPLGQLDAMNWIAVFVKKAYFREAFATRKGLMAIYDQRDDHIDWQDAAARDAAFTTRYYKAMDHAASQGDLALLQQLHADGKWSCTTHAMDGAAHSGHLHVVKWLHTNRTEGCTAHAIAAAAGNGHFDVAQWLHANRSEGCRSFAMDLTATQGHLQILQWLYIEYPRFACSSAFLPCVAEKNHKHVLRWLHEVKGFPFDLRTLEAAVAAGHFDLVKWILKCTPQLETQLTSSTVAKSARSGHFEMTQWLVQDLGLWSPHALASAALSGNLELAMYVRRVGKPNDLVDSATLFQIGCNNNIEVVEWLLSNNLAIPSLTSSQEELLVFFPSVVKQAPSKKFIVATVAAARKKRFEWDLHTKESPQWAHKYINLLAKYAATAAHYVESAPRLAAQRGEAYVLRRLGETGHPHVYTKETLHAILTCTKAGDMMQWFLDTSPISFANVRIVEWATAFQLSGWLMSYFAKLEHKKATHRKLAFEMMMRTACVHGHVRMLAWALANLESLGFVNKKLSVNVRHRFWSPKWWPEAILDAAAYGHLSVLVWVARVNPGILRNNAKYVRTLMNTAAANGHVMLLKWMHTWCGDRARVTPTGLELAVEHRHADVVVWICTNQHGMVRSLPHEHRTALAAFMEQETRGFIPTKGFVCVLPPLR